MRALGKALVAFALTLVVAYVLSVVAQSIATGDVAGSLGGGWRALFQGGTVAAGLFLLFLLVVNLVGRRRGSGSLFWINVGGLVVAIVIGLVVTLAVGGLVGALTIGYAGVPLLSAALAAGELFIGGVVALALTHFVIFRPRATEFEP